MPRNINEIVCSWIRLLIKNEFHCLVGKISNAVSQYFLHLFFCEFISQFPFPNTKLISLSIAQFIYRKQIDVKLGTYSRTVLRISIRNVESLSRNTIFKKNNLMSNWADISRLRRFFLSKLDLYQILPLGPVVLRNFLKLSSSRGFLCSENQVDIISAKLPEN